MTDITAATLTEDRPTKQAVLRGWRRRCPCCGEGKIMTGYLKVVKTCPNCSEDLSHQRTDDGPAYVTVLLVGHIVGFALHFLWNEFEPDPMVMFAILGSLATLSALYMLPRIKGAFVGLQWAKRMHGFGQRK